MTRVFTAHGIGTIVNTVVERGRTSHLVEGDNFKLWLAAKDIHEAGDEGAAVGDPMGGSLFSMSYTPDRFLDPAALMHGGGNPERDYLASKAFDHDPAWHVNEDNSTVLPYDPSPQNDANTVPGPDGSWGPGEYAFDPKQRLSPSDSRTQGDRRSPFKYPGPDPKLFAASHDAGRHDAPFLADPKELVPYYPALDSQEWLRRNPHEDHPDYVEPPAGPRHRAAGIDSGFISAQSIGLSDRYADIQAGYEPDPFHRDPLAYLQRHAAVMEGYTGLDPATGEYMNLVLADKELRKQAWRDVSAKAKALHGQGRVQILAATPEAIHASVAGDGGTYDTIIVRGGSFDLGGRSVAAWHCDCEWGQWAHKRAMTHVGQMCSHAYAAYMQMQAGVVEDFKQWAKDGDQPMDETSMNNFITRPRGEDDEDEPPLSEDEVSKLYDYVREHPKMSPQREFDVPYTFDQDRVYKDAAEAIPGLPHPPSPTPSPGGSTLTPDQFGLGGDSSPGDDAALAPWGGTSGHGASVHHGDALRMTPRSMTPDLQFVPEGEPEHFTDVTEDDRKTTGPGQILHEGGRHEFDDPEAEAAARAQYEQSGARPVAPGSDAYLHAPRPAGPPIPGWLGQSVEGPEPGQHRAPEEPEIEHFGSLFYADAEQHDPREPQARPDAGEAAGDLNKLRDLMAEPTEDHFGDMRGYNDDMRGLVDDLHDAGVDASPLTAARQFMAEDDDFLQPAEGSGAFAGSGPDPKWWFSTSEDYVNEHERPNYQDVTTFPDGDILKYNDDSGPVTSPREAYRHADVWSGETDPGTVDTPNTAPGAPGEMSGAQPEVQPGDDMDMGMTASRYYEGGALASLLAEGGAGTTSELPKPPKLPTPGGGSGGGQGGLFGDIGEALGGGGGLLQDIGKGIGGGGGGSPQNIFNDLTGDIGAGDQHSMGTPGGNPGGLTGPAQGAGADDFVHPSAGGTWPGGAGFGDTIPNMGGGGMPGAGAGDMAAPTASPEKTTFANRRQRVSMDGRPSILDSIRQRQMHGYDTTTLPPGWGDVPAKADDEDPLPDFPGEDSIDDITNSIPGVGGGVPGMPKGMGKGIPKVPMASRHQADRWPTDDSDIVRQFQASQGAQAFARGGGGGGGRPSSRSAAMGQYSAAPGGRNRFTNDDIAGAAASFLQRTAGRTYSMAEQQELMDEMPVGGRGARNLSGLDLTGTHYVEGM